MAPIASETPRGRFNGQVLAELLTQQGPLSLDLCLRYATEVATVLREMHQEGRSHGGVNPEHVVLRASGAALIPCERRGYPDPLEDLIGFGGVLYAMLTGKKPTGDELGAGEAHDPERAGRGARVGHPAGGAMPYGRTGHGSRFPEDSDGSASAERDVQANGHRHAWAFMLPLRRR